MISTLTQAVEELQHTKYTPAHQHALFESLRVLARTYGRELDDIIPYANGTIRFKIVGKDGPGPDRDCGSYGPEIAGLLNHIEVNHGPGTVTMKGSVKPHNGFCNIRYWDAERILFMAADLENKANSDLAVSTGEEPDDGDDPTSPTPH